MENFLESTTQLIVTGLPIALRIIGALVCDKKAGKLNRNKFFWAVFGLAFPIIAMIWLFSLKPKAKTGK